MTGGTKYSFTTLFFEATRLCNYACPMCMASSNDKALVRGSVKQQLTTEEVERFILQSVSEIGVDTITWSGGEFLLRRDAIELIRLATEYGYSSILTTNGSRIDRAKLLELKEASNGSIVIAVGINSIGDENSWTRDAECDESVQVLRLCEELGLRRNVVVTIGKHNLKTLAKTLQWLEDRGIPYNRSPFTARGYGKEYWEQLRFTGREMQEVIHPELRKHANGYVSYTPFFLSPELHEKYSKGERNVTVPQNPSIGCWCGTWLAVNAEGDVAPCGILLDDVNCGNVREMSFEEIIDRSVDFQRVLDRDQLQGRCGRCRYKFTCGGCRAMAFYEHGDLMAEDPTCFFEPEDGSTVCEHEEETNRVFRRYVFMKRQADHLMRQRVRRSRVSEAGELEKGPAQRRR